MSLKGMLWRHGYSKKRKKGKLWSQTKSHGCLCIRASFYYMCTGKKYRRIKPPEIRHNILARFRSVQLSATMQPIKWKPLQECTEGEHLGFKIILRAGITFVNKGAVRHSKQWNWAQPCSTKGSWNVSLFGACFPCCEKKVRALFDAPRHRGGAGHYSSTPLSNFSPLPTLPQLLRQTIGAQEMTFHPITSHLKHGTQKENSVCVLFQCNSVLLLAKTCETDTASTRSEIRIIPILTIFYQTLVYKASLQYP